MEERTRVGGCGAPVMPTRLRIRMRSPLRRARGSELLSLEVHAWKWAGEHVAIIGQLPPRPRHFADGTQSRLTRRLGLYPSQCHSVYSCRGAMRCDLWGFYLFIRVPTGLGNVIIATNNPYTL